MRSPFRPGFVALSFFFCSPTILLAQIGTAEVVGRVYDPSGAVLVSADVELRRVATNELFKTKTTATGDFSIVSLPVGQYELRAGFQGFRPRVESGIQLEVGRVYRFDVNLEVGSATETVAVVASAPVLKTENPEFGQVIDNQKITELPLNSRDITGGLALLSPSASPARSSPGGTGISYNVRGQRVQDNMVYLDGAQVSNSLGGLDFAINPDAVQEFELKTGLYSSQYGVRPGGQFSLVTKSGTNQLHGTLFEFLRNNVFNARNFFDRSSRPPYKRNQFGGVIGGPVYIPGVLNGKNKAWFFFSYAASKQRQLATLTGVTPTAAQKSGVFAGTIIDPLTGQPFPNNTIPAARIDPIATKYLAFYPDPNTPGALNFTSPNSTNRINTYEFIAKVDFKTSDNDRWAGRFMRDNVPISTPNVVQTFYRVDPFYLWSGEIQNTRVIHTGAVNEFTANFLRRTYLPGSPSSSPANFGTSLGIANFSPAQVDQVGVPLLTMTGFLGVGDGNPSGKAVNGAIEVRDNFTINKGAHAIKLGYHFRRQSDFLSFQARSLFDFTTRYSGNAFADFLLGYLTDSRRAGDRDHGHLQQNSHYGYVQDDWKVGGRLTVNLGLRYQYEGPWSDRRGFSTNVSPVTANFEPPLLTTPLQPWETPRFPSNVPLMSFRNATNFEPRIGLAWRLAKDTVVRAGYGLFGNEPTLNFIEQLAVNPRPGAAAQTYNSDPRIPALRFADPFNPAYAPGGGLPNLAGFQSPYPLMSTHSWGIAVQQALGRDLALEVGYQGSNAVHDAVITNWNDATPGPAPILQRRPFPQVQSFAYAFGNGTANYQALEAKVEKRPGKNNITALLAYTWSKSIDDVGGRNAQPGDPTGISRNLPLLLNRGLGEANVSPRFDGAVGYLLPFGHGRQHLAHSWLGQVIGNWNISAIFRVEAGPWIDAVMPSDLMNVGSTSSYRPDVLRNPNLNADQRNSARWFDTSAFASPPAFTYGNAGRSIIQAPAYRNVDLGVVRNFPINERARVEFRFETFNLLNHTNFGVPNGSFGTATFGVIGSAYASRDLQFGLKLYY